jgi:lysophospholipase L1-like esterase
MQRILLAGLCAWFFSLSCLAQEEFPFLNSSRGTVYRAPTSTDIQNRYALTMASDLKGNPWAVWVGYDGEDEDLFYSHWNGSEWTVESKIAPDATSLDKTPSMLVDNKGTIWVAWTRWKKRLLSCSPPQLAPLRNLRRDLKPGEGRECRAGPSIEKDIYVTRWEDSGWIPPQKVNSPQITSNLSPQMVVDPQEVVWIFWSGFDGVDEDIYYSYWNGQGWQPEARVNPDNMVPDVNPSAKVDESGIIWVTWKGFDGQGYRTYSNHWTSRGWSPPVMIDPQLPSAGNRQQTFKNLNSIRNETYIAFGDSITAGVGDEEDLGGYPFRLETLLDQQVTPSTVLNEGYPGETTFQGVNRIDGVLQQDQARYILLMEGTNDIYLHYSTESIAFNLGVMIDKSRAFGTLPVLATIIPLRNLPGDPMVDPGNLATMDLNDRIRQLAQDKGVTLVDQFQAFSNYPDYRYTLYSDFHHPNGQGYDLMAETWFNGVLGIRVEGSVSLIQNAINFPVFGLLQTYLDLSITAGTLDLYVRLLTPKGTVHYLVKPNKLGAPNTVIPLGTGLTVQETEKLIMGYLFKGTEPPGIYTWTAMLVLPGTDVENIYNWVSSSSVSFSFTP